MANEQEYRSALALADEKMAIAVFPENLFDIPSGIASSVYHKLRSKAHVPVGIYISEELPEVFRRANLGDSKDLVDPDFQDFRTLDDRCLGAAKGSVAVFNDMMFTGAVKGAYSILCAIENLAEGRSD
ncbi:hypothetical protein CL619_02295 [archaeon]|nr:hypothetical protein [archaeon]|tara:strand:- start:917 stop:1300 length:384 start_codon:yes stop_codon:yes gene_type:complete